MISVAFIGRVPRSDSAFDCGQSVEIPLDQLCDGLDHCGLINSVRAGDDETAVLCDSKQTIFEALSTAFFANINIWSQSAPNQ